MRKKTKKLTPKQRYRENREALAATERAYAMDSGNEVELRKIRNNQYELL